ncbi:MAG: sigma-70 family RNA polymerase sigma factor [bacterium]|nr:sigma-70 family RNA polymerase sigma factor [bacterium]
MATLADNSDEQLLLHYRETGERQAFSLLVKRYERELYRYLKRYLNDAEMAEDAFQATFLQVHLKCEKFESGRRFRPWLYAVATNQAIDAQRRNKRHRLVSLDRNPIESGDEMGSLVDLMTSGELGPVDQIDLAERRRLVQETLEELPENMQSVIHLVYYQGLKYREAAESLNVPVGTVKSRIHSAMARLTEAWKASEVLN